MTCPPAGAWRAWLDHQDSTAQRLSHGTSEDPLDRGDPVDFEEHLASCPGCQRVVGELRDDVHSVHHAVAVLAPSRLPTSAEVAMARERLERRRTLAMARATSEVAVRRWGARIATPWRMAASGIAAVLTIAALVAFTPEGGSAAAAFLAQFRSQQLSVVEVTPQSQAEIMRSLNGLGNLGTLQVPGGSATEPQAAARAVEAQSQTVTLPQATQMVGFAVLTPDPSTLPAGMSTTPRVSVTPGSQVRFTFDKKKAQAYFQSHGHPEVSLPDKFDGATLIVTIPSAAVLEYRGTQASKDALVVGEAGQLVVDVQGNVSLPELRDFLLGLPGMPSSVVSQLKQIQNWNETLPIPVPVDQVQWQSATLAGTQGLLLNDNSGTGSAAVWQANGHLIGVVGSVKASDLLRVANSLAPR
jgi:hypothetical protein